MRAFFTLRPVATGGRNRRDTWPLFVCFPGGCVREKAAATWHRWATELRPYRALAAVILVAGVVLAVVLLYPSPTMRQACDCGGRFEFANVAEVALVRGVPQTVQLGFYQLDPANPWPAGDQTRASGWTSRRTTKLVDAGTGAVVPGVDYNGQTGELTYSGEWSGAVSVRLSDATGSAQSAPFRIRALTPTTVFGTNAAALNSARGWNAKVCEFPAVTFKACRAQFVGGASDAAPLVLFVTPGTYAGQDFYLGGTSRRYLYVLGDPASRPVLLGDTIGSQQSVLHYFANLDLRNTNLSVGQPPDGVDAAATFRNITQCCETGQDNGIVNSNRSTRENTWSVYVHNFETVGMGGTGNTTHSFYIEGRPNSLFDLNNVLIRGSRNSSAIKTTMQTLNVRHSKLCSQVDCDNPKAGQLYAATPIDVPAYVDTVIYANRFVAWREAKKPMPGLIFFRMRQATYGSDIPAYPHVSWDPPVSAFYGKSPGGTWSKGPETYVADQFWKDVVAKPLDDPTNPFTFKHYVANNVFELRPGSAGLTIVRDDGTGPGKEEYQFGPQRRVWTHIDSVERSTTFMTGNQYVGFPDGYVPAYRTDLAQYVSSVQEPRCEAVPKTPCTKWPRSKRKSFRESSTLRAIFRPGSNYETRKHRQHGQADRTWRKMDRCRLSVAAGARLRARRVEDHTGSASDHGYGRSHGNADDRDLPVSNQFAMDRDRRVGLSKVGRLDGPGAGVGLGVDTSQRGGANVHAHVLEQYGFAHADMGQSDAKHRRNGR